MLAADIFRRGKKNYRDLQPNARTIFRTYPENENKKEKLKYISDDRMCTRNEKDVRSQGRKPRNMADIEILSQYKPEAKMKNDGYYCILMYRPGRSIATSVKKACMTL